MLRIHPFEHIDYALSHRKQKELVEALKQANGAMDDHLLLCEHPPTYTFGKSADHNNLLVNDAFLETIGAKSFEIERGGDITYHGPGQLVGYPILNLKQLGIGVRQYVYLLEQSIIDTMSVFGIEVYRIEKQIGLWVNQEAGPSKKIAAIGIKVSQGITMHGFALNVNTDLSYFTHIIPCGISDKGVTSMAQELGKSIDMTEVISSYRANFQKTFYSER